MSLVSARSFHFLNHLFQIIRHFRQRLQSNFHCPVGGFANDRVHFRKLVVLIWIIFTELRAATFLSLQRRASDRLRNGQQVFQVERGVPSRSEERRVGKGCRSRWSAER